MQRPFKLRQGIITLEVHATRYKFTTRTVIRQRVSLQPMLHLQSMFERAQKMIRVREL